jgi:hypothetical protein
VFVGRKEEYFDLKARLLYSQQRFIRSSDGLKRELRIAFKLGPKRPHQIRDFRASARNNDVRILRSSRNTVEVA